MDGQERNGRPPVGALRRFRAWMDLGRAQGVSTTAAIAIIGAMTADVPVEFLSFMSPGALDVFDIIGFTIVAFFAHTVPNCYIELGDLPLDSQIPESSMKPVVSGVLNRREIMWYVRLGLVASWMTSVLFFPDWRVLALLGLSALWVMWYGNGIGKRIAGSYDFSFSLAYGFLTLYGVYAVGQPTIYSWLFMGVVVTGGTAFAQWENSLKDIRADRATGVRSFAVLMGVEEDEKLSPTHPFMLYGYLLKGGMLLFCFWALYEIHRSSIMLNGPLVSLAGMEGSIALAYPYAAFLLTYGIGSQVFLMWRFLKYRKRLGIRRTILLDVPLSALVGFSVVIGVTSFFTLFMVILFLVGGYFVGSSLQYSTEFKFGRYEKVYDSRMKEEERALVSRKDVRTGKGRRGDRRLRGEEKGEQGKEKGERGEEKGGRRREIGDGDDVEE